MLDPFASSGSSLLAARMLGRDFIGIEIDSGYQAIAERRLASGGGAQQDNSEFSIYRISESYQILEDI